MTQTSQISKTPLSVTAYVEALRRSSIVEDDVLAELEPMLGEATDSTSLGQQLISHGVITGWQNSKLLQGRWQGYLLGKYLLLDVIGRGGMGRVMLGQHKSLRHKVAIKILPRRRLKRPSAVRRFRREAQMAAQLNHMNVTRTYDADEEHGVHYLVMEYVDGCGIDDIVKRDGPLAFRKAADFARQAADGLHHAHEHGLIHRDVKPSNLLVSVDDNVKILDFGLARSQDDDKDPGITREFNIKTLGTADYLAPEQAVNSQAVDRRADIYSLGCTFYFMLAGHAPFPSGKAIERIMKHCTEEPESLRAKRPDIPQPLLDIWCKLTRKKPNERYDTAAEVASHLQDWLDGKPIQVLSAANAEDLQSATSTQPANDDLQVLPDTPDLAAWKLDNLELADSAGSVSDVSGGSGDVWNLLLDDVSEPASAVLSEVGLGDTMQEATLLSPTLSNVNGVNKAKKKKKERPASKARLGEYSLWLCIAAGLILGITTIGVAVSYISSFSQQEVHSKGIGTDD